MGEKAMSIVSLIEVPASRGHFIWSCRSLPRAPERFACEPRARDGVPERLGSRRQGPGRWPPSLFERELSEARLGRAGRG